MRLDDVELFDDEANGLEGCRASLVLQRTESLKPARVCFTDPLLNECQRWTKQQMFCGVHKARCSNYTSRKIKEQIAGTQTKKNAKKIKRNLRRRSNALKNVKNVESNVEHFGKPHRFIRTNVNQYEK